VTTVRRAAAGLSALASCLLLLLLGAPVALAGVGRPDPSTASSPARKSSATVIYQTSGLALWAVVLIALGAAVVGALAAMAVSHAASLRRPRMLPA
jgi:hypothetical protein